MLTEAWRSGVGGAETKAREGELPTGEKWYTMQEKQWCRCGRWMVQVENRFRGLGEARFWWWCGTAKKRQASLFCKVSKRLSSAAMPS